MSLISAIEAEIQLRPEGDILRRTGHLEFIENSSGFGNVFRGAIIRGVADGAGRFAIQVGSEDHAIANIKGILDELSSVLTNN